MHVLIISQYYWPETFRITEVAESLLERGCQITVLTGQPNYPGGEIYPGYWALGMGMVQHQNGYPIYRVPILPRGRGGGFRLALNYISYVLSASFIGSYLLRGQKFDVVFVYAISPILQGIAGAALSRFKKAAHVIWVQDLWPESLKVTGYVTNRFGLSIVGFFTSWIYRCAHLLLVQSPGFKTEVSVRAPCVEVRYHPNPAERAVSQAGPTGPPAIALAPGFNVVFAGNLGTAQALGTILDTASILSPRADIHFTLIGSGSMSGWLTDAVKQRGLTNVGVPGRVPPYAMPAILGRASALLVTLVRDEFLEKVIPSKVSTYLASGRPIVAALDGEGAKVITAANAGLAVPAEDAQALADAIERLSSLSVQERDAMGRSGRKYYEENFEPKHLADQLVGHFEEAIRIRHLQKARL